MVSDDRARYPLHPLGPPLAPGELDAFPSAAQLLVHLDTLGLEKAVLVQRGRAYGFDNSYVCDMALAHPQRLRAVCSIDARDARCAEQVTCWIRNRGGSGIRLMEPVKGADSSWLDGDTARQAWRAACELDVPVAVHFFPWNRAAGLAALATLVRDFPQVTVILDGVSGIPVEAGAPDFGIDERLAALAEHERVYAKLTHLTLSRLTSGHEQLARRVMQLFGAERVMWGSDLVSAAEPYARAVERVRAIAALLTERERNCLLGDTAARVYRC